MINTCPHCGGWGLSQMGKSEGLLECDKCGGRTHRKIEENRDALESLANSNLKAAEVANLLIKNE